MNQCRNQNRPNTLLLNVFWKHDTFLARIRKVIKLKERSQVSNPTWVTVLPLPPRNRYVSRNRKSANPSDGCRVNQISGLSRRYIQSLP